MNMGLRLCKHIFKHIKIKMSENFCDNKRQGTGKKSLQEEFQISCFLKVVSVLKLQQPLTSILSRQGRARPSSRRFVLSISSRINDSQQPLRFKGQNSGGQSLGLELYFGRAEMRGWEETRWGDDTWWVEMRGFCFPSPWRNGVGCF